MFVCVACGLEYQVVFCVHDIVFGAGEEKQTEFEMLAGCLGMRLANSRWGILLL